jgi:hypothetical protein
LCVNYGNNSGNINSNIDLLLVDEKHMHRISEWFESLVERGWEIKSEINDRSFSTYFFDYATWFERIVIIMAPILAVAGVIKGVNTMSPTDFLVVGAIIWFLYLVLPRSKR